MPSAHSDPLPRGPREMRPIPNLIFLSRWLQLPLYLGLSEEDLASVAQALAG